MNTPSSSPSPLISNWALDPSIVFLNHGSFGACPVEVLQAQTDFRRRMEAEPVRFFVRELDDLLREAREKLAAFIGADAEGLAFVTNATTGINTVLASFPLNPGDEVMTTNHEYNACRNALVRAAEKSGAHVIVADIPFPIDSKETVLQAILDHVSPRTRLVLIDHVTSQTGLVFPIAEISKELEAKGISLLVDGAHAPGMLDLDLKTIGAPFYTGNCHKWMCAPKGAAFLWVRDDWRQRIRPLVISHGANALLGARSRFRLEFDWTGTDDPSSFLCLPTVISTMARLVEGGWLEIRALNKRLVLHGRDLLCNTLEVPQPCPDEMIGSLASIPLPDGSSNPQKSPLYTDPLQDVLLKKHSIEVPIIPWPAPPKRLLRISAQLYNSLEQYNHLAEVLKNSLP